MRAPVFFTLCLAAALALSAVAIAPAFKRAGGEVAGAAAPGGAGFLFDGGRVSQFASDGDVAVTAPPGISGGLTGVALAAVQPFDAENAKGARLLFAPDTRAALAGQSWTLTLNLKPLLDDGLEPAGLSAGFVVADGPVVWVEQALPAKITDGATLVSLNLPAPGSPPLALAIWPSLEGEGRGFQILDLALTRSPAGPTNP